MTARGHPLPRAFVALATAGALASLLALGASAVPALDLVSHFRIQYLAGLAPALLVALALRMRVATAVLLTAGLVHGTAVARAAWPAPTHASGFPSAAVPTRIVTSNLLAGNPEHAAQLRWLAAVEPDIVVFQEYTPTWHAALSGALDRLPHRHVVPRWGSFGIALYSRWPILRSDTPMFDTASSPSVAVTLDVAGTALEVIGTHPAPPLDAAMAESNRRHVRALAAHVAGVSGPVVVAGDLNLTQWSAAFRELEEASGLDDARRARGVLPTWSPLRGDSAPARLARTSLGSLPIDHVLTGGGVHVTGAFAGESTGSDHRGLVVDVRVPE